MFVDNYIQVPGASYGGGVENVAGSSWEVGLRRPYKPDKGPNTGYDCVTVNTGKFTVEKGQRMPIAQQHRIIDLVNSGKVPLALVANATALRKEEWLELDRVVLRAARYRLRAWADLAAANSFGGFNGMAKTILEHETMSDPGEAVIDMDGLTDARTDEPLFQLQGLPLPITHSDFWFSARKLAISRNTGTPLDVTMGESAGRRVAESIEKVTIGMNTGPLFGGASTQQGGYGRASQVYGYVNFPARLTNTLLYLPTGNGRSGTGWKPADTLADVLGLLDALRLNKFYGPFMCYHSNDWDQYMDNDYILTGGNVATQTLRNRLRSIEGIQDVRRLDMLFASQLSSASGPGTDVDATLHPFTLLLIQMTPDVARAVNGMDITTVQWEAVGGMRLNFKVMCIQVPQLRADFYGNCGIMHAYATR